jgi:hypothetical protein
MIWRSCERLNVRPPFVKDDFEDCDVWTQSSILAYGQIRDYEDMEMSSDKF